MSDEQPWVPIESDPDIMTQLVKSLTMTDAYLIDVPVIDGAEEMGIFLDHNVVAFVFLYTINDKTESVSVGEPDKQCPAGLFHMKQVNRNACGTVALFHSFLNTLSPISNDSIMARFYKEASDQDYSTRGKTFSAMGAIKEAHQNYANFGQSDLPSDEELNKIAYHYVAIVEHDGHVYELDGRRQFPVKHQECTKQSFISAGLSTIQSLIQRDPDNYNFSILAFCKPT